MRTIDTCLGCPDRKRVITETEIFDCHSTCERYKAANIREQEKEERIKKAKLGEKEHLRYMANDKEKRRRMNYKCNH